MPPSTLDSIVFEHKALDTTRRQIRLIKLHRRYDPCEINCSIQTFDLDSAPKYIALSYTWGDASQTYRILINGLPFEVRENLHLFLENFCNDRANVDYLWIDQICIDQNCVEERNRQVGLMGEIYCKCQFVISWLGCAPDVVEAAREFHRTQRVECLQPLLHSPYFTRIWIVQEVLLAPDTRVMCGDLWIEKQTMQDLAEASSWNQFPNVPLSLYSEGVEGYEFLGDNLSSFSKKVVPSIDFDKNLKNCLTRYSGNDCTDPRDKVYGLLGLVNYLAHPVQIDYSLSVQTVFLDAILVIRSEYRSHGFQMKKCQGQLEKFIVKLGKHMDIPKKDIETIRSITRVVAESTHGSQQITRKAVLEMWAQEIARSLQ